MAFATVGTAYAQNAPQQQRFELASIKPGGDIFSTRPNLLSGRIRWTTQLCYLIGYAYHLDFSRVTGRNSGSVYSIEATFEPSAKEEQIRLMMQSLLTDRFQLQTHRITKEAEGYALVAGKGGLKIREATADEIPKLPEWFKEGSPALRAESFISASGTERGILTITGRRVSMSQLAETLQRVTQTPMWDQTGTSGNYYFAFRFAQGVDTPVGADTPSLATALEENLGIKLRKQKGPVESLVIDSIKEPSEN